MYIKYMFSTRKVYIMDMDEPTFGQLIKEARMRKRKTDSCYSLRKFAAKVGISPTYLCKAETDEFRPPRAEKVICMAEELGIDKYLLLYKANHIDPVLKSILLRRQGDLSKLILTLSDMTQEQIADITKIAIEVKERGVS